jgi:hypothetical protein
MIEARGANNLQLQFSCDHVTHTGRSHFHQNWLHLVDFEG